MWRLNLNETWNSKYLHSSTVQSSAGATTFFLDCKYDVDNKKREVKKKLTPKQWFYTSNACTRHYFLFDNYATVEYLTQNNWK